MMVNNKEDKHGKPSYERAFCIRMKSTLTKRGCHFKVQLDRDNLGKSPDIIILNMPAILPEMDGDAIGSAGNGFMSRLNGVGFMSHSCLTNGGDMIDVDAEAGHSNSVATTPDRKRVRGGILREEHGRSQCPNFKTILRNCIRP